MSARTRSYLCSPPPPPPPALLPSAAAAADLQLAESVLNLTYG